LKTRTLQQEEYLRLRRIIHELGNVSTGLLISAGLLEQSSPPEQLRRYCERITEAAERSAALVREARKLLGP
jgi:nitrogen-specific signal transduction histidine kinase